MARMTFARRLLFIGITMTVVPLVLVAAVTWWTSRTMAQTAYDGSLRLANDDMAHVVGLLRTMSSVYRDELEGRTQQSLAVAADVLEREGRLSLTPGTPQAWDARNQETQQVVAVVLPAVNLGARRLEPVTDPARPALVVDEVRRIVGGTSTLFQRMNERGDMLRVATNVVSNGRRAIGTFIPATSSTGAPNPVVSAVLGGRTFVGRAFVVDGWYASAYMPLVSAGEVVGMLYVGVPEKDATERLQAEMRRITMGTGGRAFLMNATDAARGTFVIAPPGIEEGRALADARDADGAAFVDEIARRAETLDGASLAEARFALREADGTVRARVARFAYFAPWDWVIGVVVPEDELLETANVITALSRRTSVIIGVLTLAAALVAGAIWWVVAGGITRRIRHLARQLVDAAAMVSAASAEVSQASQGLARGASEQSEASQRARMSLDEVTGRTRENARAASEAAALAETSRTAVNDGAASMQTMAAAMASIDASSRKVADIVKAIDGIAFQTNILALNAAVEAARAGDAGLGFAVVADEVRALALRSAEAAKQSSERIDDALSQSTKGVAITGDLEATLTSLVGRVNELGALVAQIAIASADQRQGIEAVTDAVSRMDELGQGNAASAEETAAASQELQAQAATLDEVARTLAAIFTSQAAAPDARRAPGLQRVEARDGAARPQRAA